MLETPVLSSWAQLLAALVDPVRLQIMSTVAAAAVDYPVTTQCEHHCDELASKTPWKLAFPKRQA